MRPGAQWFEKQERAVHIFPAVLMIIPCRLAARGRDRLTSVRHQLLALLVHVHHWIARIVGSSIDTQDIFHMIDKVRIGLGENAAPQARVSTLRTRSCEMLSTYCNSANRSTRSRKLQRSYPSGGSPHANAIRCASCAPSSLRSCSRRGLRRLSASSKPFSSKRFRTLATQDISSDGYSSA